LVKFKNTEENMKKIAVRFTSVFLVLIFICTSFVTLFASAEDVTANPDTGVTEEESDVHVLVLQSEALDVVQGKTIQMTASVSGVETQPQIFWNSLDPEIATVDNNGEVKGINVGRAVITATAYVDGETLRGEFAISVITSSNFLKDFLVGQQVLSYQYSYIDDYYYTNDKEAWQYNFGFGKVYDIVSPYILLEYDYVRVFFTYEDKDWMLQMWKGQYGMIFYGGEIGIYNRAHSEDGVNEWTMYECPDDEDWLKMELTMWHEELDGSWTREFTREYDKYWWCTGFKNGHLRIQEPADELRLTGRITFKDAEMTKIVVEGLEDCGFKHSKTKDSIGLDQIYVDGNDVSFCWQNISDAESTMAIKTVGGLIMAWQLLPVLPMIIPFVSMFGFAALLVSFIL
jgi:hypothetical protein